MSRSDELLLADWRLACMEETGIVSAEDVGWLRLLVAGSERLVRVEPGYELAWRGVTVRARRLLAGTV